MPRSRIIEFYAGDAPDHRGRSLDRLQTQTLDALERNHDYIQWLFPLPEPSSASAHAPILSRSDIVEFEQNQTLRRNLVQSLLVMLRFYGLQLAEYGHGVEVRCSDDFAARSELWLTPFNHNFLRLTRILRSLSLLGCKSYADALFECLQELYRHHSESIGQETFRYWQSAVR